ncbi:hypothetical protein ONS96_003790 [Cadophora gregata f. sp. sojae]|nr:hypothetical protein ONS96_003790 [Cadophora gregata f. sp. sojae]
MKSSRGKGGGSSISIVPLSSLPSSRIFNIYNQNGFNSHFRRSFRNYQDDRSAKAQDTIYTASNGAPVPHPYEAQRAGENGPLLLQDFHLIDLLSHFDRERIPERVVHAKGSGAHGVYRTTDTLEDLCLADMFQAGKECPVTRVLCQIQNR